MKKLLLLTLTVILVLVSGVLFACGEPAATTPAATTPAATTPAATTPAATTPAATTPAATTPAATTPAATETEKYGGTLRLADAMGVTSVGWPGHPMWPHGGPFQSVFYDTILKSDPQGNILPCLATEWEIAPDKKSITLTLRKGVKFHDGSDWNATVAKWNMDVCIENNRSGWNYVESVDVVDDYNVRLNLSSYANTIFTTITNTTIVSKAAYDEHGEEWMLTHGVGTGPFKQESYTPDVVVKGVRFDDYWGGKPYLDAVEVYWIMDATTRAAAFEAREMDAIMADLSKAEHDLHQKGFDVEGRMVAVYCLFPDSKNADSPFSKKEVRDALFGVLDRESLTSSLGYGWWTPSYQLCLPFMSPYIKDLPTYKYTPDEAKQMLADAGYADGFKAKLYADGFVSDRDALTAMQGYWSQIGVTFEIEMLDMGASATYATQGWNNGLFGAARTFWGNVNGILADLSVDSAWWVSMDKTDEYDKLYRESLTSEEFDPALAQKAIRYLFDEVVFIPVYTMQRGAVIQPYVHDTGFLSQTNFWLWNPAKAWLSK